jgi:alpha-2-macroglobulin-like protein
MSIPRQPDAETIDSFLHSLLSEAEAAEVTRLTLTKPAWALALAEGKRRYSAVEAALPPTQPAGDLAARTVRSVIGAERARKRRRKNGWLATVASFALAAGVLIAVFVHTDNLKPPSTKLEWFGQQALLADAPGSLRVRLINERTQQPVAGMPVNVALQNRDGTLVQLATFQTDARGTGTPQFRVPDWADGSYTLKVVAQSSEGVEELSQPITLRREFRLMLSTDKPVYQPGQTVHARSLALRRPDLKPLANQTTLFTLTDPKGNVLFKKEQPSSKFGIAAADCALDPEITEGPYTLKCQIGNVESLSTIDVRRYVLPKFKLDITFDKPYYRPGDTVKGSITGAYFFGKPVADGTLTMEVRTEEPGRPILDKRTVKTDTEGKTLFDFVLPAQLPGRPQDQGDARFTLTALLQDSAGQSTGKSAARIITAHDFHVEVIPEGGPVVPGLDNLIYLYVSTPDGKPLKATVQTVYGNDLRESTTNGLGVAVVGLKISESADAIVQITVAPENLPAVTFQRKLDMSNTNDFLVRTDKAVYTAGETLHLTAIAGGSQPVFIDLIRDGQTVRTEVVDMVNGQAELAMDLPPELAGTLELCAYRFRGDGLPVRKLRTLVVKPPQGLQVKVAADKPEYRPGESAKLSFTLTDAAGKPAPGALSLAAVDEAVYAVLQQRPGLEQAFYLLEQELLKPVATIYAWEPSEPLPVQDRQLFELALFSSTARTINVSNPNQNWQPRPTERSFAGRASPHTLVLSNLADKVRDFDVFKSNRFERIRTMWMGLSIAGILAVCVALCQMIGTKRIVLGTIALLLVAAGGWAMLYYSPRDGSGVFDTVASRLGVPMNSRAAAKTAEMALPVAADRGPLSEAPPGPKTGGADEPPLRVRDRFPETLLWQPELVTDDSGKAELEVPLADSITTWRLCASAVAADGRLGALQSGIRVFQPFFVDLDLPVALTRNDMVSVPVVVSNFLDTPQTVTVTVADADWCERTGDATQTLELPPRAVRSARFPLKITKVGTHKLVVTARGQGVADAVRRNIEIVPDGRLIEQVVSGTLDQPMSLDVNLPADAIPDSAKLLVRLYPSAFSQLVEGLDSIFQMPHGCFEQTSSTTYPNVLALQYLRKTKQTQPEVEAKARQYIHLGYQRLVSFEVTGGGFDWFGHAPADVPLTAYGLREFKDMAQVHDVDPHLIQRTRAWLLSKRNNDGSWEPGRFHGAGGGARLNTTAYVAASVFDGKADLQAGLTRDYLLQHGADAKDDATALTLVIAGLQATGAASDVIESYIDRLLALKKTSPDGKLTFWEQPPHGRTTFYSYGPWARVETTSQAILVLLQSGKHASDIRGALPWLVGQKDNFGTWHSTQATVLALQALIAGTGSIIGGDRERKFIVSAGDQHKEITMPVNQADVVQYVDLSQHIKSGATKVNIEEPSGTGSGYQLVYRHYVPGGATPPPTADMTIDLTYDRSRVAVGDALRVIAKVTNAGKDVAPMVILDLPIPGGFAVEVDDFAAMVQTKRIEKFQVTPRQVIVYLRLLEPGQTAELTYRLKATMPVTVSAATAKAYEYYNPSRRAASGTARLEATER